MRAFFLRRTIGLAAVALAASIPIHSQTPSEFYWVNFHSPKDQSVVVWVTRSLAVENWTAIREIGVEYDAALVVTADRATPQSPPNADTFNVWSVSLTSHLVTPILHGVNLRWMDWLRFSRGAPLEPSILYDNCRNCAANTYFTSFYYDQGRHRWAARWLNGSDGVPVWNSSHPAGMSWTQVYAAMTGGNGVAQLVTWNHFDFGKQRPAEDSIYSYDVDPFSGLDRTIMLSGKQADAMKVRLCTADGAVTGLARGQDSELCQDLLSSRGVRRPVTTPAGNSGRSTSGYHIKH
ncbi:MAG: hypothetical protein ACRD3N_15465 [Terracidiphilus sp.]